MPTCDLCEDIEILLLIAEDFEKCGFKMEAKLIKDVVCALEIKDDHE